MGNRNLQKEKKAKGGRGTETYTGRRGKQEKEVGGRTNPTRWFTRQKLRVSLNI